MQLLLLVGVACYALLVDTGAFDCCHKATQRLLSELGVAAKYVLVSGDHPLEDVAHIQQLGGYGALAIWYNNKPHNGVRPDFLLLNPNQLTTMLRKV